MSPAISDLLEGFVALLEVSGDDATVATSAGSRALRVLFEEPTEASVDGEPVELSGPMCYILTSDLPINSSGSYIKINNRNFRVSSVEPDSLGVTKVNLAEK